jgi:hypothetical protein
MDFKFPDDVSLYTQLVIGSTGLFAFIMKVRGYFSDSRRKQNLKTDLEILELCKKSNVEDISLVQLRVKEQIESSFNHNLRSSGEFGTFLTGLFMFVGFGLWTADIFQRSYPQFNPWSILTIAMAVAGLSMLLFSNTLRGKYEPFILFGIYDKKNLQIGLFFFFISAISLTFLVMTSDHFNFGMFLSGLFLFVSIRTFVTNIKRVK